jgi:hypothetical protein
MELGVWRRRGSSSRHRRTPPPFSSVKIRGDSYRLKDKKRAGIFTVPAANTAG